MNARHQINTVLSADDTWNENVFKMFEHCGCFFALLEIIQKDGNDYELQTKE